MTVPALPVYMVDLIGSALMILLAPLCLYRVRMLKQREPDKVIWTYLQWVSVALVLFAVSRSPGHILQQVLAFTGRETVWRDIRPYSGAINTLTLILVGAVTLFFKSAWGIYQHILEDQKALQAAHRELVFLNQNLERMVRKRTRALAESEEKYRRIFEMSRDTILVTDMAGVIGELNPLGFENLGFAAADPPPRGIHFKTFFADPQDWEALFAAIRDGGFVTSREVGLLRRDGSPMLSLVSGSLDPGGAGREGSIHFLVKDIEAHRRMEKQMAQADKLASIGEFSAGIAHEINNPLGVILGYTQLLLRKEPKGSERAADLKTIEKQVRNCKGIVEDLLHFARSSKPVREKVAVNRVVEEVVAFVQQHARLGRVKVETALAPDLPPLLLEEKKIRQVLINLMMNARHAVGEAGTIRLATAHDAAAGQVLIRVVDNGYGIDQKNLQRIFDPFFTTKTTGEGTGLGLSVSYGIVRNHGGEITVESEPGRGAEFTVSLPVPADLMRKAHAEEAARH